MAGGTRTRTRRRRRRARLQLGMLISLVSTTSAISLNDLQPIQDGVLPMACSLVYHATIQGCTAADFASGQRCSSTCRSGMRTIEDQVDSSCADVDAAANSVLSLAQKGLLIIQACILGDVTIPQTTSTTTSAQQTSTPPPPPVVITTPVLTTSRTIGSFSTLPGSTTEVLTSTTQQSTVTAITSFTILPPTQTSTTVDTSVQSTSTLPTSPVGATSSSSTTSTSSSTATRETASASTSPSQDGDGRGGGSPFDSTSGSSKPFINLSLYVPVGAALVALLSR